MTHATDDKEAGLRRSLLRLVGINAKLSLRALGSPALCGSAGHCGS